MGAKGNPAALKEMFSEDYAKNQAMYDPQILDYVDKYERLIDNLKSNAPEAITEDQHGSLQIDYRKIADPKLRTTLSQQFTKLHDDYLNESKQAQKMFEDNKNNIEKQVDLLATVMDATKEKSDLTGQPGAGKRNLSRRLLMKVREAWQWPMRWAM